MTHKTVFLFCNGDTTRTATLTGYSLSPAPSQRSELVQAPRKCRTSRTSSNTQSAIQMYAYGFKYLCIYHIYHIYKYMSYVKQHCVHYIYIHIQVCVYIYTHAYYIFTYICIYIYIKQKKQHNISYTCMYVCMYVCMQVCMYVSIYVCM